MIEFDHNGRNFRATKLNAFQQMHVVRRLTPLLMPLASIAGSIDLTDSEGPADLGAKIISNPAALQPLCEALATLPDEAFEYVMTTCLASVKIETSPGAWMPLWVTASKRAIVDEMNDLQALLPIIIRIVMENLGGFFAALPMSRAKGTAASQG